jgi:type IV pilus assembly protein PilA
LKKIRITRSRKGFTLIEIVVSLLLLAIISVAFLTMFSSGSNYISKSGKSSKTNYNLQNIMEKKIINTSSDVSSLVTDNILAVTANTSVNPVFTLVFGGNSYDIYGTRIDINYKNGDTDKTLIGLTNIR